MFRLELISREDTGFKASSTLSRSVLRKGLVGPYEQQGFTLVC
jgi:hypothetical protein